MSPLVRDPGVVALARTVDPDENPVGTIVEYLRRRGLAADNHDAAHLLRRLLELAFRQPHRRITVGRAAALLYTNRRTLGRQCQRAGLPNPCHILAFGRILRTIRLLQATGWLVHRASAATGWPDPFTFSNTMHHLTGLRPSTARTLGPLFFAEAWLKREIERGQAELREPTPPFCPSCGQRIHPMKEGGGHGHTDSG